jgi:hypothetical protein
MFIYGRCRALLLWAPLLGLSLISQSHAAAPDEGFYTTYSMNDAYQYLYATTCGHTAIAEGCSGTQTLGPFGKIGAVIEGNAETYKDDVTRAIYVVDVASGETGTGVTLYRYLKTDSTTDANDWVTVTLTNTVALPLIGGVNSRCSMAANNGFLFIGTDQSPTAMRVQKGTFALTQTGGFEPPITVSSITADAYGYITIAFGSFTSGHGEQIVIRPNGDFASDGGPASFTLNSMNGVSTATLSTTEITSTSSALVRSKVKQ